MAMHLNSLANLKKGKKFGQGQPTNLGGAPKGKRVATYLKEYQKQIEAEHGSVDVPANELVALALVERAMKGDLEAIQLVFDYLKDSPSQ